MHKCDKQSLYALFLKFKITQKPPLKTHYHKDTEEKKYVKNIQLNIRSD